MINLASFRNCRSPLFHKHEASEKLVATVFLIGSIVLLEILVAYTSDETTLYIYYFWTLFFLVGPYLEIVLIIKIHLLTYYLLKKNILFV